MIIVKTIILPRSTPNLKGTTTQQPESIVNKKNDSTKIFFIKFIYKKSYYRKSVSHFSAICIYHSFCGFSNIYQ